MLGDKWGLLVTKQRSGASLLAGAFSSLCTAGVEVVRLGHPPLASWLHRHIRDDIPTYMK